MGCGGLSCPTRLSSRKGKVMTTIELYVQIDKRIDAAEEQGFQESLRDRWEFGKLMLAERVGKQLPKGRLDELAKATGKSRAELKFRAQFAERYPTEDEVANALATFTSWKQIIKSLAKDHPDKPRGKEHRGRSNDPQLIEHIANDIEQGHDISGRALQERYGLTERTAKDAKQTAEGLVLGRADAVVIDWDSIPATAQRKLETARRQIRRELEAEFEPLVQKTVQERLKFGAKQMAQLEKESRRVLDSRKGVFTRAEFDTIRSCLHPDSRLSVSDEKLAKAFRTFNEAEIVLLSEADHPTTRPRLPSLDDLMKQRNGTR